VTEGISDENVQREMFKLIVASFLKSPIVTERNKNNMLYLIQKQPNRAFEEQYIGQIKAKITYKKYTVVEN
jgi:hypothetical protein